MKPHQKCLSAGMIFFMGLLPSQGYSQYFKCTTAAGKIEFSDKPCQSDARREIIVPRENTVDTSGHREQIMRQEINELRQRVEQAERQNSYQQPNYGRTGPDLQAERIDSRACEAAKRNYEIVADRIKKDEASIDVSRSAMYGACGMRKPDVIVRQPLRREYSADQGPYTSGNRVAPRPSTITSCDAAGCWDNTGGRYTRGAGNTFLSPRGACQNIGGMMRCP